MAQMDEPWEKKPDTKAKKLNNFVYMKCPEYANLQSQKVDMQLPRTGGIEGDRM